MQWQRQDQMAVKERKKMKEEFLSSLLNDKNAKWKYVMIDNQVVSDYMISNNGDLASLRMCKLMKPAAGSDGYIATIIRHNGKKINVAIHRLVAETFIPNPDNLPEVNHKDGNKNHNYVSNLEWMTHQENIQHAIETGLRDNYLPQFRYSSKDIHKVCKMLEKGKNPSEISNKTGVSKRVIKSIRRGKAWKHISKKYKINKSLDTRPMYLINEEQASTTIQSIPKSYEEEIIFAWEM